MKQGVGNVAPHLAVKFGKGALPFGAIDRQGVALAHRLQANAGAEVLHMGEVVHPVGVNGFERQQAHQRVHIIVAQGAGLGCVEGGGVCAQEVGNLFPAVGEDLFRRVQLRRRRADLTQGGEESLRGPVIGMPGFQVR